MVQTKKTYTPLELPNGGYASNRNQSNNMSFAKKAAMNGRDNANGFRTDSAISGNRFQGERELQRWVPDSSVPDASLEPKSNKANGGAWDQFAANEKLFGLKTDYDENIYTTTIDRNHPDYERRAAVAERKAREIENSTTTNRHVAEERIRDNLTAEDNGPDEEDKYSGVQRQDKQDFPPLAASSIKYMPPGRRPPAGKPAVAAQPSVDPAIISSKIAQPAAQKQAAAATKAGQPQPKANSSKPEVSTPPTTTESSFAATPEVKATPANTSTTASRTESPKTAAPPAAAPSTSKGVSATDTVERDVASSFKAFAARERTQAEKLRLNKAKADKESKLQELKAFASSFKLHSAIPPDLVAIIAKDPAKQRAMQEASRRQADELQQEKALKASTSQAASPAAPATPADPKGAQRSSAQPTTVPNSAPRHTPGRAPNAPQGPYNNGPSFRQERNGMRGQGSPYTGPQPQMGQRMRNGDQNRNGAYAGSQYENRQPPTGPSDTASRRTSAASSQKMNPASLDFRPNPSAATFNPNGSARPSAASTPRSESVVEPPVKCESASGLFIKRRPGQPSAKKSTKKAMDIMARVVSVQAPEGKDWSRGGGIRPAFDTLPTWKQLRDDEPEDSLGRMTYPKLFEKARFVPPAMSPRQNVSSHSQVPHQHQLPFHLQQGAQRPSPRVQPMHMHNSHTMGQPFHANNDDHRMVPSLSAQSFASPRLQQVPMYPSPAMGQPAQIAFQPGMQPVMHYMGPGAPQMGQQFRSYSNAGQQFIPQQPTHMGGPVMMAGPQNPYFGSPNLMPQQPQMMYPAGQPMPFPQQGGPPVPMPGANGYPSPGRPVGAPMMMQSGSQQGQQAFPMSPGMQYGQPIYAQHVPQQMQQQMRGFPQQGPQFQGSPMPHYNQPHHNGGGRPNGNGYNNRHQNNHNQHHNGGPGPHVPAGVPNNVPTGPQRPTPEAGNDEAK